MALCRKLIQSLAGQNKGIELLTLREPSRDGIVRSPERRPEVEFDLFASLLTIDWGEFLQGGRECPRGDDLKGLVFKTQSERGLNDHRYTLGQASSLPTEPRPLR